MNEVVPAHPPLCHSFVLVAPPQPLTVVPPSPPLTTCRKRAACWEAASCAALNGPTPRFANRNKPTSPIEHETVPAGPCPAKLPARLLPAAYGVVASVCPQIPSSGLAAVKGGALTKLRPVRAFEPNG